MTKSALFICIYAKYVVPLQPKCVTLNTKYHEKTILHPCNYCD